MIIPVRCFTCNKILGDKYEKYLELISKNQDTNETLRILNIHKQCCRRMLLTHVDLFDKLVQYG